MGSRGWGTQSRSNGGGRLLDEKKRWKPKRVELGGENVEAGKEGSAGWGDKVQEAEGIKGGWVDGPVRGTITDGGGGGRGVSEFRR